MEITVQSVKVVKSGTNKSGPWELIRVTTPDGTEYTTFDKKAKHMGEGAVIDIGEPTIKEGKISFKEIVRVVKEGVAPAQVSTNGKSPEQIALERASIEGQTAYNGMIQLIGGALLIPKAITDLVFRYAQVKMENSLEAPGAVRKPETAKEAARLGFPHFNNAGEFLSKCQVDFSMNKSQVLENDEVRALYDAGEYDKAYGKLTELQTDKLFG